MSRTVRFEVFKRDKFTCQYCGRNAPEVVLHVDHIKPVSKDGDPGMLNLITSCADCNGGKGARELSDDTMLQKQKAQLHELQERRDQIEMMLEWQKGLICLRDQEIESALAFWAELVPGYQVNENGRRNLKKFMRRFGFQETLDAMRTAAQEYLSYDTENRPTRESVEKTFEYTGRIAAARQRAVDKPYMRDLYYIRGILRNRLGNSNDHESMSLLEKAVQAGADVDDLSSIAKRAERWRWWEQDIEKLILSLEDSKVG